MNKVILFGVAISPEYKSSGDYQRLGLQVQTTDEYLTKSGEVKHREARHLVVAWGNLAQLRANLEDGEIVMVEGRLQTRKYQDAMGYERYVTEVVASTIEPLAMDSGPPAPEVVAQPETSDDGFDDDDMPF